MNPTTETRPWGSFSVIDAGPGFKVKRISVAPGQRLSLQFHHFRAETWMVAAGCATVTVGEQTLDLTVGQTIHIPVGVHHRLANTGSETMELIELQFGARLEEADIVRLEDSYGRCG